MFLSAADARRLMLPNLRWAGDAIVIHSDGHSEIVRDPLLSPSGYYYVCPQGYRIHDPDMGCAHRPKPLKRGASCG